MKIKLFVALLFVTLAGMAIPRVSAEAQAARVTALDFSAGSDFEEYLRALQIAGKIPLRSWSFRQFSTRDLYPLIKADSTGPWKLADATEFGGLRVGAVRLASVFNSAFPYGSNDGAVWTGRGLTLAASGGFAGQFGPLSIALEPVVFWSRNAQFAMLSNGASGNLAFNHGTSPGTIDLPQRFGNSSFARMDPGQSSVRLDTRAVRFGISTANEWIEPATENPFLLGNNAPGFPHVFLGTGDPVNVGFGRLQARFMWGKLYQSRYSPAKGPAHYINDSISGRQRLATTAELVVVPRGVPGLEIGFARFFHVPYKADEPSGKFLLKPLEVFFLKNEKAKGDTSGLDNQLATVFFRWTLPRSGFEVFGERGYEDQFYDLREFLQDIDHNREYMLGFQKTYERTGSGLDVIRGELVNYQRSTQGRLRQDGFVYVHAVLRQGHTNRGQLLGASSGAGAAAASTLSWTRYAATGRTTFTLRRIVRDERDRFSLGQTEDPRGSDVLMSLGAERVRFGKRADFGVRVETMREFNRNFLSDASNVYVQVFTQLRHR